MKPNSKKAEMVTRGLVEYLKKSGQLNILPQLIKETLKKSQTQKDPSKALVISAIQLSVKDLDEIKAVLSKLFNREITAQNTVDPTVIGGLQITIGDKIIDNTIRYKLQNLGERLAQ